MASQIPQKGAIGLKITVTVFDWDDSDPPQLVAANLESATVTKNIMLRKPSGAVVTKTGTFVTDGTDGKIRYITLANDLDQAGLWKAQAALVLTGFGGRSSVATFPVAGNVDD